MTLIEKLSLRLTEDQLEVFLQLVEQHSGDIPVHELFRQALNTVEE